MVLSKWDQVRAILEEEGFAHHGCARLEEPMTLGLYRQWLEKDYAGEMDYLRRHLPQKENPSLLMENARSAIVVAINYVTHPEPVPNFPLQEAKVALYARGEDYHFWIKRRLARVIARLQDLFPNEGFVSFTDSAPVLERDLAYRAGLGWVGKNTCLIHPKRGSLFLLGEIYTTMEIESGALQVRDFCGTCTRCLDVCPTGALVAPRELDARRCLSYLTIEAKGAPPEELRSQTEGWFFGCDLCQTVCPWNIKFHGREIHRGSDNVFGNDSGDTSDDTPGNESARRTRLLEEMRVILTSSNSRLLKMFERTPLTRAGGIGLKRNAILVAVHAGLEELRPAIESLRENPRLSELAVWALEQLNTAHTDKTN